MSRLNISASILTRMQIFESTDSIDSSTDTKQQTSSALKSANSGGSSHSLYTDRLKHSAEQNGSTNKMMMSSPPPGVQTDADGLILPKKLINPCLESSDRKQLHRELKFNNKVGKSVLNQKTELQRAYEKQKERQQQHNQTREDQSPTVGLKSELNRVIMERAQKHACHDNHSNSSVDIDEDEKQYVNPEYLNVRAKLRTGQRTELK
ncbi:protein FAM107B [Teleopsis dalmanni]|uniref:protein FAM107B n=1 Tax=Teleopsis dalmanni TaxID=139649 RepID=UPI0018CD9DC5|nr:protein FAM107B [Teleopsis dalmanni]